MRPVKNEVGNKSTMKNKRGNVQKNVFLFLKTPNFKLKKTLSNFYN